MEAGATTTMTAKLSILNLGKYDLWLIKIEQYFLMTNYSLWEVVKNGNKVLKKTVGISEETYEPTSAEEKLDRRNEMKARGTLLMALPNKDQLNFIHTKMKNYSWKPLRKGMEETRNQRRAPKNQDNRGREYGRKTVPVETLTENALIAQDGIRGYDWSYQVEEEIPTNYAFMALTYSGSSSSSEFEVDSCSKSCMKAYANLKEEYDSLTSDYKKSQYNLLSYKAEKQENGSDKGYHAVPPPLTGNYVPLKRDLRLIDENFKSVFVDVISNIAPSDVKTVKTIDVNHKGVFSIEEPKLVMKNNFSPPIIEDWYSDDESNPQQKEYKEKGVINSGCSMHMTRNKCYLTDLKLMMVDLFPLEIEKFCEDKGIKREFNVARTPQQNEVAERRNRTLTEAARTMLADSKLPTTFWVEAVNTACYVLNRALVTKPHNKVSYELIRGRSPLIDFMKPFGYPVTILNTRDNLGKFEGKADKGYFIGYSVVSKAIRVFNKSTRIVEETLNIRFQENTPNVKGNGPDWLFDIDSLTISMNYVPFVAGNQTNGIAGSKENLGQDDKKKELEQEYILIPICTNDPLISQGTKDSVVDARKKAPEVDESKASDNGGKNDQVPRSEVESLLQQERQTENINSTNSFNTISEPVNTVGSSFVNAVSQTPINAAGPSASTNAFAKHSFEQFSPFKNAFSLPHTGIFANAYDDDVLEGEFDMNNLEEQTDGEAMINSIKNSDQPLPRVTQVSIAGTLSTEQPPLKGKSIWSDQEKKIQKIDRLARSFLIQGLLNDIYSLIDNNKTAKDLWDALDRHMLGSEYSEQDRKAAVLYEYKTFKATEGELLLDT
nr:retrovirus-related Pol polyprotein from transposon TNT 1-94 [Tanacetum cinerariifolium]